MFADDLILLAESVTELQKLATALEGWCQLNLLKVNVTNTKVMVAGKGSKTAKAKARVRLCGETVEVVPTYKYLGLHFTDDLVWKAHVNHVQAKVKQRMGQVSYLFCSKSLTIAARLAVYQSLVLPLFTYGAGLWTVTEHQLRTLEEIQRRALKRILGTSITTTTAAVLCETGVLPIELLLDSCRLKFFGRLATMKRTRLVHEIFSTEDRACGALGSIDLLLSRYDLEIDFKALEEGKGDHWNALVNCKVDLVHLAQLSADLTKAVKCTGIVRATLANALPTSR
jgi:hypothetical protein